MTDWKIIQANGIAAAQLALSERSDASELRKAFSSWIRQISSGDGKSETSPGTHPETLALALDCERRGLDALAEAVRLVERQEGKIPQGRWLLARLLGNALADNFLDELMADKRYRPEFLSLHSYGAWGAFVTALTENLQSNENVQAAFWREIERVVEKINNNPGLYSISADSAAIRQKVNSYQDKADIKEAWDPRLDAYVYFSDSFLFKIARKISTSRFLDSVRQLPHPVFVDQCIELRRSGNLPELIRLAPPAFDDSDLLRPEGMVLISVLKACANECRRICWGDHDSPHALAFEDMGALEPVGSELLAFVSEIIVALSERADASLVGWAWLERLFFEGERQGIWRCDRQRGDGIILDPLTILVRKLASTLELNIDYLGWINDAVPLRRIDRMAAVMAVAANNESSGLEERGAFLMNLVATVAPAYTGATVAFGWRDCVIGRLGVDYVLSNPDPAEFVRAIWDTLRPIRERAWRAGGGESRSDVGELAVLWAICAMEAATGGLKLSLWYALREILESAMQTDQPSSPPDTWPSALRRFFRSTSDFLTGNVADDTAILTELLRPFVRADQIFFELIFTLEDIGIDRRAIEDATNQWGMPLEELATRYFVANRLRIERQHLHRPWLDRVGSFIFKDSATKD